MSRGVRKLEEGAARFLREGERIEVIQPVRNKGSLDAAAVGGAVGALAGARGIATVKELLSEVPLAEVDAIEVSKVMLGARKRITVSARGGSFVLETPGRAPAQEFTDALARVRTHPAGARAAVRRS